MEYLFGTFLLPDNMRYAHGSIVNSDTEVIHWLAIASHDHEITKRV
jgi:hypothetical protein